MRFLPVLFVFFTACSANHSRSSANTGDGGAATGDATAPTGSGGGSAALDDLSFAVIGDTRPPSPDDTAGYPTAIITKIYQDVAAESPAFAISTGDYMFATTTGNEQEPQLAKYMAARAAFSGPLYPVIGNHECTGATASNCGLGATDGITKNMTAFANSMLAPIGVTSQYYTQSFAASDSSWTAKVVFVACNAWNANQASWLDAQLARATTYTFVVRHEGVAALGGTPCSNSQTIIDAYPLTLLIVGHTHTYGHYASDKEIIVGNGGAPLSSGANYGYVIARRNASGTITVTSYDYMTRAVVDSFTIQASGAGA
jgi:hypothetical protein